MTSRKLASFVLFGFVNASLLAAQQVTPPPLHSVNSNKSLWSLTGVYVGLDGGSLAGGGVNYELGKGKFALLLGGSAFNGSFGAGDFKTKMTDSIVQTGLKYTLRPSRVYADDGTVVDAQFGAAAYATASTMFISSDVTTPDFACLAAAAVRGAPAQCSSQTTSTTDTQTFS